MHIVFLNPQGNFDANDRYWTEHPDFGGQLVYVKETAIALGKLGHQVDIITRRFDDPRWQGFSSATDAYPENEHVRILRFPCGPNQFIPKESLWPFLGAEWTNRILDFYQQENRMPDVFTAHYADGGVSAAILSQKTGIPFTFTGHSLGAQKLDKLLKLLPDLKKLDDKYHFAIRLTAERISINHAAKIITSTRQERFEQYGHPAYRNAIDPQNEKRFAVIPPGVNREIFSNTEKSSDRSIARRIDYAVQRDIHPSRRQLPLILASSRLDAKKNIAGLVEAYAISSRLQAKANLAIAVRNLDAPLQEYTSLPSEEQKIFSQIIAIIKRHNLFGKVTAFALNDQQELAAAYRLIARRKSVFALTSLYEPFGLAPLEAMSCGLPVVVTKNGGPSESLCENGHTFGMLVDPMDKRDIARGLLDLLCSPSEWERLAHDGMARIVSHYIWEKTAIRYQQAFTDILIQQPVKATIPITPYFFNPSAKTAIPISVLNWSSENNVR